MKTIKTFLVLAIVAVSFGSLQAQDYNKAVGVKLGYGLLGSYKQFLNESSAFEVFGGFRWSGIAVGGFYQIHKDIESVEGLRWFYGGGASFSTWDYGGIYSSNYSELALLLDIGLEYTFDDLPLNISADYAPGFVVFDTYDNDLFGGSLNRFRGGYGALTVRYILGGGSL